MKQHRYAITEADAATQAETLVNCTAFMRDVTGQRPAPSPRITIALIVVTVAAIIAIAAATAWGEDRQKPRTARTVTPTRLWRAICIVESGNNPNAPDGDGGRAVGIAQIWPCVVKDCNDWLGRDVFTLEDRRNPRIARIMFDVHCRRYAEGKSAEWIARSWNGGPGWESKPADVMKRTAAYWEKVRKAL